MPHAFFLTFRHLLSKICQYDQKQTLFTPIFASFCTPKRCTRVHCLVLKNNPNYVKGFFSPRMISNFKYKCLPRVLWSPLAWDVTQHMSMSAFEVISTLLLHTTCALYPLFFILVPKPLDPYLGL